MIVYHERTGEPIEATPCPFADDYPGYDNQDELDGWSDAEGE